MSLKQILNYGAYGLVTNTIAYAIYFFITSFGGTPKLTMTLLYLLNLLAAFFINRLYIFKHRGHIGFAGLRFLGVHFFGYIINFFILLIFVDYFGFQHQIVQALSVFVVALMLFIAFRMFVFKR